MLSLKFSVITSSGVDIIRSYTDFGYAMCGFDQSIGGLGIGDAGRSNVAGDK